MEALPSMSHAEYLAFEAVSDIRHEYWYGDVYAMAGASPDHNQITTNVIAALGSQWQKKGCRTAVSDQRVRLGNGAYVYPDVVVACSQPTYTEEKPAALLNPTLLIEVVSSSSVNMDRKNKLEAYTQLASLQEYWIVEQDEAAITRVFRKNDLWVLDFVSGLEQVLTSEALGVSVALEDIYTLVDLPR